MLAGCAVGGSGAEEPSSEDVSGEIKGEVSLQTWALKPNFTEYVEGVIDDFEAEYPDVTVKWLDQPGDGYDQKVLTQAASGDLPDVTNLPPDFAAPLAEQGILLDLKGADDTLEEDYVAGGLEAYEYPTLDGTYGYPWYLGTDVNFWNADMLEKNGLDPEQLPTSLDELVEQARVLKEESGGKLYMMSRMPGLTDFANNGVELFDDEGRFVFNEDPAAVELLQKYVDAYAEGLMPKDILTDTYQGNWALYEQRKVAWTTGGGNGIGSLKESNPSLAEVTVPSPAFGAPPLYVQGLSVKKDSENLAAAIELARWVTNAENQKEFAQLVPGIFPSTTESADDPFFSESDGSNEEDAKVIAFESLKEAQSGDGTVTGAMNDVVNQQISLAISGDASAQEALDVAAEEANKLLDQ